MATDIYNPRDKYYRQSVNRPLAPGPVRTLSVVGPTPSLTLGEFSRGIADSPSPANSAFANYGKFDPEANARLRNIRLGYLPGRFARGSLPLPAPTSAVVPYEGSPNALVPRNSGAMVPASNVIEGQFTKVGSPLAKFAASTVGKALPFVGDAAVGYMASQDPDGDGPLTGGLGRGLAAGVGSFLGRTAGAGLAALTGPAAPATALPLTIGGSIGGGEGGARLYDYLTGQARLANPSSPEEVANYRLVKSTPAEQVEHETALAAFPDPATREELNVQKVFPGETSTPKEEFNPKAQIRAAEPVAQPTAKTEEKSVKFQGPSEAEMKRFRTLTGTKYDANSVTDKLNLERMRAGEQTMTSKQSRQWRNANPTYRPGMYSRMKK